MGTTCCSGCIQNSQYTGDQFTVILQSLFLLCTGDQFTVILQSLFLLCTGDNVVVRVAPVCLGVQLLTVANGFSEKASSSLGWMPG